jgi:transglutaminase-like putative cysteine protease
LRVLIRNRTDYIYEEPVSFSPHLFRLFPKADSFLNVRSSTFETNETATVRHRRDLFDNPITHCFYPEPSNILHTEVRLEVLVRERNAFDFLLETEALEVPFDYSSRAAHFLAPYLNAESIELPFFSLPEKTAPTVSTLVEMNDAIFRNLEYERRDEGEARSPKETLSIGRASCRDFNVLLAAALRGLGLASRLASGFLCEFETAQEDRTAEGALHAWTEVFLPGAGWVGLDPTNGAFCNHNHITTAVGLTPQDVAPVRGHYYGDRRIPSRMEATLEMTQCNDQTTPKS